jgi:hypothetical protein
MDEETEERHCPLCNGLMQETEEQEVLVCSRCRTAARFEGEELLALKIPRYHLRLEELSKKNAELLTMIEAESGKGVGRDMGALRSLHEERQRVLSEYSFMSYFQQFIDKW